jgi:hypothetical protein
MDDNGCICSQCNGVGHEHCVPLNVKRAKQRAYRQRMIVRENAKVILEQSITDDE